VYRSNSLEEAYNLLPAGLRARRGEMGAALKEGDEVLERLKPNSFETDFLISSLNVLDSYHVLLAQVVEATCLRIISRIFEEGTNFGDKLRKQARDTIDAYKKELRELARLWQELAESQEVEPPRKDLIQPSFSDPRVSEEVRACLVRNHGLIEQAEALLKGALTEPHTLLNGNKKPSYARVVHDLAVAELRKECCFFSDPILSEG